MAYQQSNTLIQAKVTEETLTAAFREFDAVCSGYEADFLVSEEDDLDDMYLDEGFEYEDEE